MVFEDLQWADPGLIDFVESILKWSRNHPLMVITLARPELMDRRPNWGAGQRSFTSLHLEPLSDRAMGELLDGFVQGLPGEVSAKLLERAEGVPLYAVETVRMLVDRGVLLERDGAYSVAGELGSLEIPETLQALIASRLDALPQSSDRSFKTPPSLASRSRPRPWPSSTAAIAQRSRPISGTSSERSSSLSTPTPARPNEVSTGSSRA